MFAVFDLAVFDVVVRAVIFLDQLGDEIERVINRVNDAVVVAVGMFIEGSGLKPEFETRCLFAVPHHVVQDAVLVFIKALIISFAAPPQ